MSHFFRPKRWDTDYVLLFIIIFLRWAYRQTPAAQVFQQSQDAFHRGLHIWSVSSCFICPFYHTTLVRPKVLTAVNLFFQHVDCFFITFLWLYFSSPAPRETSHLMGISFPKTHASSLINIKSTMTCEQPKAVKIYFVSFFLSFKTVVMFF